MKSKKALTLTIAALAFALAAWQAAPAKAFGAHTPMYIFNVPNPSSFGGQRITFTWERDG